MQTRTSTVTSDRQRRLCGVVCSLSVLFAVLSGAAVPLAGAQQIGTGNGATATFNQSTVSEEHGDIAAIGLNLSNATTATVTVGSAAVNYETNVTVRDDNNDGNITLLMNTFVAGMGENESSIYTTAADADAVVRTNRTTGQLNAPLDTSAYNLSVAVAGRQTDTATLELTGHTAGDLVTWTAPAESFNNVTNASEVATAVENGRITTTDTVATGDVLVLQFKLSGIYGALAASNFTQLVRTGALNLTVEQTNPGTNRRPKQLDVTQSLENGSIRVIPDERNDVLYVNIDTGEASFENGEPMAGDEFQSTLTIPERSELAAGEQSVSANVTLVGAELSFGEVVLSAGANQTVRGTTSVAPGSEVTVRLQNNDSAFVKTNTTPVKANGTFIAEFNLLDVAPNTTVSVRADGPLNTSDRTTTTMQPNQSNELVETTSASRPISLRFTDQQTTGETITVRNVTLPAGGFVVVHAQNVSSAPVESVLGASSYLENASNETIEISLDEPLTESTRLVVMAHTDSNDNQVYDFSSSNGTEDGPYTVGGNPVTASAQVEVVNTTASSTVTASATTGTSVAAATDTTSENGPGFGLAVAVFVLAMLAVVALARRD